MIEAERVHRLSDYGQQGAYGLHGMPLLNTGMTLQPMWVLDSTGGNSAVGFTVAGGAGAHEPCPHLSGRCLWTKAKTPRFSTPEFVKDVGET